jgi:LmbE family N-acetylglucosaminyl deacetylase
MNQFSQLDEIGDVYEYVYLSPHLDDAVLSCGGAISARAAEGGRVLVVTLCTAVPTPDRFGPLAVEFHGDWNLSAEDAVTARLHEDLLAMERVGADCLWVGMLDSIYRVPFGYDTRERLFGVPRPDDPLYADLGDFLPRLRERLPAATFYAPLGIGFHVDHQITFDVASRHAGELLAFYEDIYYALEPGELERRLASLSDRFVSSIVDISSTLTRKIGAIDTYASQVPELFGGSEAMAKAMTAYGSRLRPDHGLYGERVWMRAPGDVAG